MNSVGLASFEEVKKFSHELINVNDENINEVYNMFVNNPHFQNEYNILQLYQILKHALTFVVKQNDALLKISFMFMEKYNQICNLLEEYFLPKGFICILHTVNKEEPTIFNSGGFKIYGLRSGDKMEYIYKNNVIMVITILKDFPIGDFFSVNKFGNFYISYEMEYKLEFNDLTGIKPRTKFTMDNLLETIGEIIINDDVDTLTQFMSTYEGCENTYKNVFMFDISFGHNYRSNPIYKAMLYGSIKCFKYLYLSEYYNEPDILGDHCCIQGKNTEILRILINDNKFKDHYEVIKHIIQIHDIDLFTFWYSRYGTKKLASCLTTAADSYNYTVFEYLINEYGENEILKRDDAWILHNFTSSIKINNFEIVEICFRSLFESFDTLYDEHVKFILSELPTFENITKDRHDILFSLILSGNGLETFNYVKNKLFPDDITLKHTKRLIKACCHSMEYSTISINFVPYFNSIVADGMNINFVNITNDFMYSIRLKYIDLELLDWLLSKVDTIDKIIYPTYIYMNTRHIKTSKFTDLVYVLLAHGADCEKIFTSIKQGIQRQDDLNLD